MKENTRRFRLNSMAVAIGVGVGTALGVSNDWSTGIAIGAALVVVFSLRPIGNK